MSVCSTSPVSSYSSLTRQHLAQPSQSDSHSWRVICDRVLRRQNGRSGSSAGRISELFPDRLRDVVGFGIDIEMPDVASVGPHEIDDGRMVHGVVGALAGLVVEDPVFL